VLFKGNSGVSKIDTTGPQTKFYTDMINVLALLNTFAGGFAS
jgi:hypothetical protein